MDLLKTPLYEKHIENKAKIVDFGGWALPIEYESILKETKAVRTTAGLFDASHMGEIKIEGPQALNFLQHLTPNDISLTSKGQLQYNVFLNANAGVIDDLMVYNLGGSFLCVANASNIDKVYAWLKFNQSSGVTITNESASTALLSLQGPRAVDIMEAIAGPDIRNLKYMHFIDSQIEKIKMLISRSGYTGEDGFEIYCNNDDAGMLWEEITKKGKAHGLTLCGLGSRDILRIEAGYPLYGHELSDTINPLEASLDWVVKFNKEFIAKDILKKAKDKGIAKKRVGFMMEERAIARAGYQIYSGNSIVGEVTSGTYSPNIDKFIGMASIAVKASAPKTAVTIKIRDRFYKATITKFDFIRAKTKR
ncbi:MAG: glycine cleavage system aminomethyltransferase GcvT [Candidatus Omnitrophica bacterium]|nr:glycine cleavage system aminomethyltransferase GcvT [Candidatus Omnitrophota bacterium]